MQPIDHKYRRPNHSASFAAVFLWILMAITAGSSLAQQSIEERCRIEDPLIWSKTAQVIFFFNLSDLPEVRALAADIQLILTTYANRKQRVPALQFDCQSLITEGIALMRLEMSLEAEGGEYNEQCYNRPKTTNCTRWLNRLINTKNQIAQRRANFENLKAAYYGKRQAYDHTIEQLTARLNSDLSLACQKECRDLKAALEDKRSKIRGLQEALRRLDRSQKTTQAELSDWARTAEEASEAGWQRGKEMLISNLGDVIGALSGDLEKWGGKDAVEVLETQLTDSELKQVVKDLKDVQKAVDGLTWTSDLLEPSWEEAYSKMTDALDNPKVQKLLKIGGNYAKYGSYLKSIVDSSYDISAEIVAWMRIRQADSTAEGYLNAVNSLHERMVDRVAELNAIKKRMEGLNQYCGPCEQG